ncbi:MAG: hypothetical protein GY822_12350 [Deltaproteobacteria bacterium]|nr:hypothetical protein [Deltaproteobacteria bacterium]
MSPSFFASPVAGLHQSRHRIPLVTTASAVRSASVLSACFFLACFFLACCLTACAGEPVTEPDASPDVAPDAAVNYADDVGPLVHRACLKCHTSDEGIAPFALETYAQVAEWATPSLAAMQARTMPPWGVTADGSCNDFRDSRWLSDDDIALFATWVDEGKVEGDSNPTFDLPTVLPALEHFTSYQTPSFSPVAEGSILAENDEYRCFRLETDHDVTQFLTGYDVLPGNAKIVHHVLVMPVDPARIGGGGRTNDQVMSDLDDASPDRLGWPCFGAAGDGVNLSGIPVAWAPGQGVVKYPAGTGVRVEPGEALVVQLHYNLIDPADFGASDSSEIRLQWENDIEKEGWFAFPDGLLESLQSSPNANTLPAGEADYSFTFTRSMQSLIFGGNAKLWGVMPHMHGRGTKQNFDILKADGSEVCGSRVTNWDFNWQGFYMYENAIDVEQGDEIRVTCNYDTSDAVGPTYPGWGTTAEMCLAVLFFSEP